MSRLLALPHDYPRPTKHLEPYARNNDPDVTARWCAKHPGGWTDMDGQALTSSYAPGGRRILFAHWPKVERNGFTHIVTSELGGDVLRPLSRRERRSRLSGWSYERAQRLRAPDGHGGWWRPATVADVARAHAEHGCTMVIEAKPHAHMGDESAWLAARADCDAVGCRLAMKVMPTFAGWRRAMKAAHAASVPGAVIGGGRFRRQPVDLRFRRQPAWIAAVWAEGWHFRR